MITVAENQRYFIWRVLSSWWEIGFATCTMFCKWQGMIAKSWLETFKTEVYNLDLLVCTFKFSMSSKYHYSIFGYLHYTHVMNRSIQLHINYRPFIKINIVFLNLIKWSRQMTISTKHKDKPILFKLAASSPISCYLHRCNRTPHWFSKRKLLTFAKIRLIWITTSEGIDCIIKLIK